MKRLILSILAAGCMAPGFAETVSQKQAMQLAQLFFNEAAGRVTAPPKLVYNGRKLTTNRLFTPFYVYNTPLGGFVIISADNKAFPILGYSLKESFDPERLGEAELALLRSYAREVEFIRYDTEPIDATIWTWTQLPDYIDGILKAKYEATDPKITVEESRKLVDEAIEKEDAVYSDLYTPEQWRDMMADELSLKETAPIAFLYNYELFPAVVYGRKGDYFRIEMTTRNDWLMRLNATEVIPSNMVSVVVNHLALPEDREEQAPFEEHDAFLEEVATIERNRSSFPSIDIPFTDASPEIVANGGGHYEITLPQEVASARVYNLSGAMMRRYTYAGTTTAHIDLSAEPFGFYIVTLEGADGTPYGLKLSR